jgi:hypothetical protein
MAGKDIVLDTNELRELAEGASKNQFAIGETVLYACAEEIDKLRIELNALKKKERS